MATFEKDIVEDYGSLDAFAKADGCYRIYESDSNYHVMRKPADEEGIINNPFVRNPRLVWERGRGRVNIPLRGSAEKNNKLSEKKWWQFWK